MVLPLGILAAFAYAAGGSARNLLQRLVLRKEQVHFADYNLFYQVIGALLLLPFALFESGFSISSSSWALVAIAGLLWSAETLLATYSTKQFEVSKIAVLRRFKVIWVLLLAYLIFGEPLTSRNLLAGTLVLAGSILVSSNFTKLSFDKNSLIVIGAVFLTALASMVDKLAIADFPLVTYAFLMYLIPAIASLAYAGLDFKRVSRKLSGNYNAIALASALNVATYLVLLYALKSTQASTVLLIAELSIPFTAIGGVVLLHERKDLKKVLAAMALVLAGSVLLIV